MFSLWNLFRTPSIEKEVDAAFGPILQRMGFRVVESRNEVQWASMVLTDGQVALQILRERWQYWIDVGKDVKGPWWNFNQVVVGLGGEKQRWTSDPDYQDPTTLPYLVGQFSKHKDLVIGGFKAMSESEISAQMTPLGFNSRP